MLTLIELLKKDGIEAEKEYGWITGKTVNGRNFMLERASHARGQMFTLNIEGMQTKTRCTVSTVRNLLKMN